MALHRSRYWAALACVFAGALLLGVYAVCSRAPPAGAPASRAVRAVPAELFVGDLKRLEPHLGLSSGCVRLEFGPPDRFITLEPEVWQDGKPLRSDSSSARCGQGPAEASISITSVTSPGGKPQYRITTALSGPDRSSTSTRTRDAPGTEGGMHTYFKTLDGPVELPEGRPVAVWACLLYKPTSPFPPDAVRQGSFKEAARGAVWAVVFKVGWEEPKGPQAGSDRRW